MRNAAQSKLVPGDRVAVLSPSFAAPAAVPQIHEQAMRRLVELTGLVPVEYPTTRCLGATAVDRARDINAAFADPSIKAILATIGGTDQITVTPHVDAEIVKRNPKPFLGYSDNTNLHNFLWRNGVTSFYGGSTQVHLGAGPAVDEIHLASLQAALLSGGALELFEPGQSEDFGQDWASIRALKEYGQRRPTEPWTWVGPAKTVEGRTWGGCIEVIVQLALADRLPTAQELDGAILLLEPSPRLTSAEGIAEIIRGLGERGLLGIVQGIMFGRPVMSNFTFMPSEQEREEKYAHYKQRILEVISQYAPEAVVCFGVPFGHTRPQWILPYGGTIRMDAAAQRIVADYG